MKTRLLVTGVVFVTLLGALPVAPVAGAASAFTSDDFNRTTLAPVPWSVEDPVGDGSVSLTGAGSGDAHLALGVPGGVSHDAWGTNRALRVMQASSNGDFTIEAAFDSLPSAKYQMQGVLVEQDANNWLRFDTYHDGSNLQMFAASTTAGSSAWRLNTVATNLSGGVVLRVGRSGDTWTLSYSPDGASFAAVGSFSHALVVNKVGPFAANHNAGSTSAPAFTAVVDWFFDTAHPVAPEDDSATVTSHTMTTRVVGPGSVTRSPDQASYASGSTVELTAVPASGSAFAGWSGTVTSSANPLVLVVEADHDITATFQADEAPPVITAVSVATTDQSATITWTTDEPATSAVSYGPTTAYEDGTVSDPTMVTAHSVTLAGLQAAATYHYTLTSADALGQTTTTADATFTTQPTPAGAFTSDDFNRANLDLGRWSVVNPRGDGTVAMSGNGVLELSVPAGPGHDAWATNDSLRVLRPLADVDFTAEARFESAPAARYQIQGLMIEQDARNWLRFDFYHDGSNLRVFAAKIGGGSPSAQLNKVIASGSALYLRITRAGSLWSLEYGYDGVVWTSVGSFSAALVPARIGPFVGSAPATGSPGFTARVDYVAEGSDSLPDEDGSVEPDTIAPYLHNAVVVPASTSSAIRWRTDEPATGTIEYGTTLDYELGTAVHSGLSWDHQVQLSGLTPGVTYHYRIVTRDSGGRTTTSGDDTFTTGPLINVWYGPNQVFGVAGRAQTWVNVLGNVSHPDGVASLTYTLNDGPSRALSIGPDGRRLEAPGDFNVEIAYADLPPGASTLLLTATDNLGVTNSARVTIDSQDASPQLPFSTDWASASSISNQAQVADGLWRIDGNAIRTVELGYDRFVVMGDIGWQNYEVTVPVTVYAVGPGHNSNLGGASLVGMALRWQGHTNAENTQPGWGFFPTGAFAWYRFHDSKPSFELVGNNFTPSDAKALGLELGSTYVFKARVETVANGLTRYSFKSWLQREPEPEAWLLSIEYGDGPSSGSVGVIAHHTDVQFGNVVVTQLL